MKTVEAQGLMSLSPVLPSSSTNQPATTKQPTTKQLFKKFKTKLTDSPTGSTDTDLIKALDDVKKNAKDIYNFAYKIYVRPRLPSDLYHQYYLIRWVYNDLLLLYNLVLMEIFVVLFY